MSPLPTIPSSDSAEDDRNSTPSAGPAVGQPEGKVQSLLLRRQRTAVMPGIIDVNMGRAVMAAPDAEELARAIRLILQRMELPLPVATGVLEFQQWTDRNDGARGSEVVQAPAVLIGESVAIRLESGAYRVYNQKASPYHGLFHQGVCKTSNARIAVRVAIMAAIHEHFTARFEEHFSALFGGD